MKYFFIILTAFLISHDLPAQIFEKDKKESSEDFVSRIFSTDPSFKYKVIESKFNSPGKKIVFFFKKLAMDSSINDSARITCMFANILIPESETSNKYSLQTLKIECNRGYNITIDDATVEKDKQKNLFINILFCQLNRKSTTLVVKTYKTFQLKQTAENNFTIEEVKE